MEVSAGSWTTPSDRQLTRGAAVVKLFNAIRAAQNTSEADLEEEGPRAGAVADSRSSEKGRNELGGKGKAGESARFWMLGSVEPVC